MRPAELRIRLVDVKRLTIFIAISLALHLLLESGLFSLADNLLREREPKPVTEIELVDSKEKKNFEKPLIKQLEPVKKIDNDDVMARFDSEKTQRVEKETKTENLGLTRNASSKKASKPKPETQKTQAKNEFETEQALPEFTRMRYSNPNQANNQASAISQVLPSDIQVSDATNLNTDANTYYSFYSRVEELFYVRWGERLEYYWNRLAFEFKKSHLAGRTWSTVIEVRLTSTGEYHSSSIFKSSGYPPFDEAAVFAFKDAHFFPNPPKEKVDPDGFVRLRYRLAVHVGDMQ